MNITLSSRFSPSDKVIIYEGGRVIEDIIKEIIFFDVKVSKNSTTPKPRYRLTDHLGIFYDSELYTSREEIAEKILKSA